MRSDDWLIRQLPVAMAEDDFLVRFVSIFQHIGDTVLHQIDTLSYQFDPTVAPDPMVRCMAGWLGVDWIDSSFDDRVQREIVLRYAELIQWRGTRYGLTRLLELITGDETTVNDSGGVFAEGEAPGGPPQVAVDVTSTGFVSETDLIRIVRDELPADVTFRLTVAGREIWPEGVAVSATTRQMETDDA